MLARLLYIVALVALVADTQQWGISAGAMSLIIFASLALPSNE